MTDDRMKADRARALAIRGRIEALLGKSAADHGDSKAPMRVRRRIRKLLRQTRKARKAA